ncbi:hypothetical protein RJ035_005852 [Blastomyces gilchristii]
MNDFFLGDSVTYQKSLQARHDNFQEGIKEEESNADINPKDTKKDVNDDITSDNISSIYDLAGDE